jgi:ABC-type sugar transport system ATPase subunit
MLSEDRRAEGIFPDLTVLENMVIGTEGQDEGRVPAVLHHALERSRYDSVRAELRVRAHSPSQLIPTLSGGNQQKVLLGRALVSKSRILVLNEPTRGVDVGTKMEIHELVRGLAKQGFAILVSSSDMPEVANVSDRCLVLTAGRVTGHLAGPEVTEGNILACAMGQASRESV